MYTLQALIKSHRPNSMVQTSKTSTSILILNIYSVFTILIIIILVVMLDDGVYRFIFWVLKVTLVVSGLFFPSMDGVIYGTANTVLLSRSVVSVTNVITATSIGSFTRF